MDGGGFVGAEQSLGADQPKFQAGQFDERPALRVLDAHVGDGTEVPAGLGLGPQDGPEPGGRGHFVRPVEERPLHPEGQQQALDLVPVESEEGGEDEALDTHVQEHGPGGAPGGCQVSRQRDVRLEDAPAHPQFPQQPEGGTQLVTSTGELTVDRLTFVRPEGAVHRRRHRSGDRSGGAAHDPLGVGGPGAVLVGRGTSAQAENPDRGAAVRRLVEDQVQAARLVGEDEGPGEDEVLDQQRFSVRGRLQHGRGVVRAGYHHLVEQQVVGEERRGARQFGLPAPLGRPGQRYAAQRRLGVRPVRGGGGGPHPRGRGSGCAEPMALARERVGGRRDPTPPQRTVEGVPVDPDTGRVQFGQRFLQDRPVAPAGFEARQPRRPLGPPGPAEAGQSRAWAHLHEVGEVPAEQFLDAGVEPYGETSCAAQ